MRFSSFFFASLLIPPLLSTAPATQPTAFPTTRPGHDREPWVFRCVLDGNARSIVVSLGQHRWVAYDAATCSLTKFWVGDIELTGPVYDYKHGPQPRAKGALLLDRKAAILLPGSIVTGLSTNLGQEPSSTPATRGSFNFQEAFGLRYRGYSLKDDRVTFHYERDSLRVDETPGIRVDDNQTVFIRAIDTTVTGINPNALALINVTVPTSDAVTAVRLTEGSVNLMEGKKLVSTLTAPADIPFNPKSNTGIYIDKPGRVVVETEFKAPEK